jgi:hypothetical protein
MKTSLNCPLCRNRFISPDIIAQFGKTDILAMVGYDEESSVEQFRIGPMTLAGLDEYQWYSRIMGQGFSRG